jgi:hypothetical protein
VSGPACAHLPWLQSRLPERASDALLPSIHQEAQIRKSEDPYFLKE